MSTSKKYPKYTSPKGVIAGFSALVEASTKFKPEGEFNVKVRFKPADVEKYAPEIERLSTELLARVIDESEGKKAAIIKKQGKIAQSPFKPELDDSGEETGNLVANFKMRHKVTSKKTGKVMTFTPAIFDAKGKPTTANPWSGSEVKVNFEMAPYFAEKDKEAGVSLRLYAVQIIKLVAGGGGGDAESFGFDEEEGFEDTAEEKTTDAASDSTDGEDSTDF